VTVDQCFGDVLANCSKTRKDGAGTWLGKDMRRAYLALHRMGHAHSVETWQDGRLAGGLYGVSIGRMFYGESMFSHATDASKVALAALVAALRERGFPMIDCQQRTPLLASMGAREIPRREFLRRLAALVNYPEPKESWTLVPA
jgi:leucyl/phenylalanyl-tRNA--protein transferase